MQVLSSWLICGFSLDLILCSQPIDMNQHSINNVKSQVNKFDAVNKAYTDRIKYKSATSTIPNTVRKDHTLFTFRAMKDISGKLIICEMWVERLVGELISTSSPMFATEWSGFHRFWRGSSLITFFNGFPASGWTRNFSRRLYWTTVSQLFNWNNNIVMLLIMLYEIYFIKH